MKEIIGFRIRELFDPVQTHAAYGVPAARVDEVKAALKATGAKRFRTVKNNGMAIVCFKA
jgi:hypothetical protein|tara:strand:- start:192 stop:371 length:180 start_codon:yes stop_codon:yes gene_type:complete